MWKGYKLSGLHPAQVLNNQLCWSLCTHDYTPGWAATPPPPLIVPWRLWQMLLVVPMILWLRGR